MHQINRSNAITCCQHAIKSSWRAAALDMSQNYSAGLKSRAGFNFCRQSVANAAQTHVSKFIGLSALIICSTCVQFGAFRHHNNAEVASTVVPVLNGLSNLLDVKRLLGNQDYVSSSGDAAI